jgi:DNA-binding transcriptional regulator YiaG
MTTKRKKSAVKPAPIAVPDGMTGDQFKTKIVKLGFTQSSFARTIGVNGRSVRAWIGGRYIVPRVVAMLVNLMIETEASAENLKP